MSFQLPIQIDIKGNADKYKRIIQAAIRVFSQKGFFYAKVTDVAKAADVADGTIYLYFKNKDDLLISIFEHSMDFFVEQARTEIAIIESPDDKLKKFIELYLSNVKRMPQLAQVLLVELRSSSNFMKEYKPEKLFDYLNIVSDIIVEGQAKGAFYTGLNANLIRRSVFGSIDELVLEWILSKHKRFDIEEAGQQLTQFILNGVRGGYP